eukprot:scaffold164457_cov34-Prasinocladus_malaysianus.AAC.1
MHPPTKPTLFLRNMYWFSYTVLRREINRTETTRTTSHGCQKLKECFPCNALPSQRTLLKNFRFRARVRVTSECVSPGGELRGLRYRRGWPRGGAHAWSLPLRGSLYDGKAYAVTLYRQPAMRCIPTVKIG